MDDQLTDKQFWLNYWENKKDLIQNISQQNYFAPIFKEVIEGTSIKSCIEIGGFPGYQSIYLNKYFKLEASLLDYVIHEKKIAELLSFNGLLKNNINLIEADLFSYNAEPKFDLCFSIGLIEHFKNTEDLLQRHLNFLKPGGTLLIIVPNFLGINGWFNKRFEFEMFNKHYLECMDTENLLKTARKIKIENIKTYYYGKFSIWLNLPAQKFLVKILFKITWIFGKILTKIIPFNSKKLSPFTVLIGNKCAISH